MIVLYYVYNTQQSKLPFFHSVLPHDTTYRQKCLLDEKNSKNSKNLVAW